MGCFKLAAQGLGVVRVGQDERLAGGQGCVAGEDARVALAGRNEPLVRILIDELAPDDDPAGVSVLGHGRRARLDDAVLINGAMGHALDFDDVIMPMGHPTVPVAPVGFGWAKQRGASGAAPATTPGTSESVPARTGSPAATTARTSLSLIEIRRWSCAIRSGELRPMYGLWSIQNRRTSG